MRADKKSQYQLKKEKLQLIKQILEKHQKTWITIRLSQTPNEQPKMASEIINEIWEIVKNEN